MADPCDYQGWVHIEEEAVPWQVLVITDEEQFKKFQAKLPKRVPSKKQPAPDNKDPLLGTSPIDFSSKQLVVVMRSQSISAYPVHSSTAQAKGRTTVVFQIPKPPAEARPFGWGVYGAVVLEQTSAPVEVDVVAEEPGLPDY